MWERDDYSFLRWYVTKQMEGHLTKGTEAPFLDMIEGDKNAYIDNISEDGVPLDEVFLTAVAVVFNKDIIIVPSDEESDVQVVYGGPGSTKGKGSPLYLGCTKPVGDIPALYYSINQGRKLMSCSHCQGLSQ